MGYSGIRRRAKPLPSSDGQTKITGSLVDGKRYRGPFRQLGTIWEIVTATKTLDHARKLAFRINNFSVTGVNDIYFNSAQ